MDLELLKKIILQDRQNKTDKYKGRELYNYSANQTTTAYCVDNEVKNVTTNGGIYVNYFKQLVVQKIDFLLSEQVTVDKNIAKYFNVDDMIDNLLLNASLDACSWLYLYIDRGGKLDWTIVNDAEIIAFYDKYNKNIETLIRYYNTESKTIKVEVWDDKQVAFYEIKDNSIIENEVKPHYTINTIYNNEIQEVEPKSFNFIPFIPCYNNKDKVSDSHDIENLIFVYNEVITGFVDNINKFQEAIVVLKGFSGGREQLKETMKNLKELKGVGLPSDGDIGSMKIEIPVEARQVILELLKQAIYTIGRGMDPTQLGDGNITNVVIKARYQQLAFKANDCEKRLRVFYQKFVDCINQYYGTSFDNNIVFNKSMLINENEIIDACVASKGIISDETIISKHPWTKDVQFELEKLATQLKETKKETIKETN